jgi:hypothetical protein
MISNHAQFIDAIREKNLIRIVFYSLPDAGTVDRECMPLDYGPQQPGAIDALSRYWIWDPANTAGANPLGLLPGQIVTVQVLGRSFAPKQLPLGTQIWNVARDWDSREKSLVKQ